MFQKESLSRLFGGCNCGPFGGGIGIIILIALAFILLMGDDFLEWIFCEEMALIWIVLIILLLTSFDFDDGCCC